MKYKILLFLSIALFIFIALFSFLRIEDSDTRETIKIVTSFQMRLPNVLSLQKAIEMALEDANYQAGRFNVELVALDSGDENGIWKAELEKNNALIAANDPQVIAFIGPTYSSSSKVIMPILNRAGIVQINASNTWPGLTKPGYAPGEPGIFYPTGLRHYFRLLATDDIQGPAGAIWAKEMGFERVYILDDGQAYGQGIANLFAERAKLLEIDVLGRETIDLDNNIDFTEKVAYITQQKPDVIYFGGYNVSGITDFIKELRATDKSIAIMGPDGIRDQEFIDRIGEMAEGIYATVVGAPSNHIPTAAAQKYHDRYIEKYNEEPEVFGAFSYEAVYVILNALEQANSSDRSDVLNAVRNTKEFQKLLPPWSFDENGDTNLHLVTGSVVTDGKFEFVKILTTP